MSILSDNCTGEIGICIAVGLSICIVIGHRCGIFESRSIGNVDIENAMKILKNVI